MNTRALSGVMAEYEQGTAAARALLAMPLTDEQMFALEDVDEETPSKAVAERLAALAEWQDCIGRLAAADGSAVLGAFVAAEQAAHAAAHARVNDVFVRWFFGGWAVLPAATFTGKADR